MDTKEKVKENRLRRKLERMGYQLKKSRVRDPQAWNYGGYMIVDAWTGSVTTGTDDVGRPHMSLDEVDAFTQEAGPSRPKAKKGRRS